MKTRIIIAQIGARRRYKVPFILNNAGLLYRFYTDSNANSCVGKIASKIPFRIKKIEKLKNRKINGIAKEKIYSTDKIFFHSLINRKNSGYELQHKIFSKKMKKWGLGQANILYRMSLESIDFAVFAKNKGLKIVTDMFISPITNDLMRVEQLKFPELNIAPYKEENIEIYKTKYQQVIELSDILICPSQWVANGVLELNPDAKDKIKIVPYGTSISYTNKQNNTPIKGRFLFAGHDVLRKGMPYLAEAATIIKKKYPYTEFRIAGCSKTGYFTNDLFKDLDFLGKLNKEELTQEYLTADAFIFPTFSEGLAGTILEAMSAGLPIITTNASGIEIDDEVNGLLLKPGSTEDIVFAIEKILNNRILRNNLAKISKENSLYFSEERWAERLIESIKAI